MDPPPARWPLRLSEKSCVTLSASQNKKQKRQPAAPRFWQIFPIDAWHTVENRKSKCSKVASRFSVHFCCYDCIDTMSYSCNDNQNYFWEADSGRTTSRVLAPPGGATSICLGSYEEPAPKAKKVVAEAAASEKADEKADEKEEVDAKEEKQRA